MVSKDRQSFVFLKYALHLSLLKMSLFIDILQQFWLNFKRVAFLNFQNTFPRERFSITIFNLRTRLCM